MRIAFVTETWLPSTDGIVTRLTATVRELRALGHEVLVLAPALPGMELEGAVVRGIPTVGWKFIYDGKRWALPLPRVARYIRDYRPDVVHAVNPALLGIAAVVAARRQHIPLVASYHTDIASYAEYYRLGWLRPLIWRVLRLLHGRAQLNLATSRASCDVLRFNGVHRIRLWPRGVDTELFHPGPRERSDSRWHAVYVGRLGAEKNLAQLAVLLQHDCYRLTLVGDGPDRDTLASTLSARAVSFTGTLH
ncbi:MAG: glycosyltransferase, partial [Sciscionella sp.]